MEGLGKCLWKRSPLRWPLIDGFEFSAWVNGKEGKYSRQRNDVKKAWRWPKVGKFNKE